MNMLQDMKALPISLPWIMTILNKVKRDEQAGQGQLDLAAIEALVLNINITKYVLMVAVALWIYDFLLTFDDEVELFWKKKDGIVIKVLYLMNRYIPIFGLAMVVHQGIPVRQIPLSHEFCQFVVSAVPVILIGEIMIASSLFGMRIYTIYYANKLVQRVLIASFTASYIAMIVILVLLVKGTSYAEWSPIIQECAAFSPKVGTGINVISIFIETVVVVATIWHSIASSRGGLQLSKILIRVYVDGFLYFLIIAAFRLGNCFMAYLAPPSIMPVNIYLEYALASALTSRWFLSLRRTVAESRTLPTAAVSTQPNANGAYSFHSIHPMQPLRPGRASVHLKRQDAKLGLGFQGASSESDGDVVRSGAMTPVSPGAAAAPKTIKFDASELVNDSSEGLEVFPMDSLKHDSHLN